MNEDVDIDEDVEDVDDIIQIRRWMKMLKMSMMVLVRRWMKMPSSKSRKVRKHSAQDSADQASGWPGHLSNYIWNPPTTRIYWHSVYFSERNHAELADRVQATGKHISKFWVKIFCFLLQRVLQFFWQRDSVETNLCRLRVRRTSSFRAVEASIEEVASYPHIVKTLIFQ